MTDPVESVESAEFHERNSPHCGGGKSPAPRGGGAEMHPPKQAAQSRIFLHRRGILMSLPVPAGASRVCQSRLHRSPVGGGWGVGPRLANVESYKRIPPKSARQFPFRFRTDLSADSCRWVWYWLIKARPRILSDYAEPNWSEDDFSPTSVFGQALCSRGRAHFP